MGKFYSLLCANWEPVGKLIFPHSDPRAEAAIASCPYLKCPLAHRGMKLSDYDRGTPSVCRASIVALLLVPHSYSQLVKKTGSKVRHPECRGFYGNVALLRPGSLAS